MFELIVVLICLFLNAILSCVEMAFVTVSRPHLKKLSMDGDSLARKVLDLKSKPERVLSVLQIGITLVGAISAAVGGAGAEEALSPLYENKLQVSEEVAEGLAIVTVVIPIAFFSVVIGELVPKTLALKFPMRFAKFGGTFLNVLDKVFSPVVYLLEVSTKLIIALFIKRLGSEPVSEISGTIEIDNLTDTHKQYVLNLIEVDKRKVKDILLPWELAIKVNIDERPMQVLDLIKRSGHTRIPVLEGNEPIGILHSKEFIAQSEISRLDWPQLIRPVIFINHEEPILGALKTLQSNKNHMAVIIKDKMPIGIVTIEDIFEEVVGEIYDEDDSPRVLLSSNSRIRTMSLPKR